MYKTILRNEVFSFESIREILAKASEEKSGDKMTGLAARTNLERMGIMKNGRLTERAGDLSIFG